MINQSVRLNEEDERILCEKAKACGLKKASLIRSLIRGYHPRELPTTFIYDTLRELLKFEEQLRQLYDELEERGVVDAAQLSMQMNEWKDYRIRVEHLLFDHDQEEA